MLLALCNQALALTAPGTSIPNRAELIYVDSVSGDSVSVLSNLSLVTVGQFYDLSLLQNLRLRAQSGDVVQFPHHLTNTGNTADSYLIFAKSVVQANDDAGLPIKSLQSQLLQSEPLQTEPLQTEPLQTEPLQSEPLQSGPLQSASSVSDLLHDDSALAVQNIVIFEDVNGNGLIDVEDPPLQSTRVLAPAESLNLVVQATVPPNVAVASVLTFQVGAQSVNNGSLVRFISDELEIEIGPVLTLTKESSPVCEVLLLPGDDVYHTIRAENKGSSAPKGTLQLIDGVAHSTVVVEQAVAQNFRYIGVDKVASNDGAAIAVVRLEGVADNSWISADNWNGVSRVAAVGLWLESGKFDSAATASFTVNLQVADSINDDIFYTSAATADISGDSHSMVESNNTCQRFSTPAAAEPLALRFLEPSNEVRLIESTPDFFNKNHFVDATQYSLNVADTEGYIPSRDGVYLELSIAAGSTRATMLDAAGNSYLQATVASELTGDHINVVMLETDVAGVFRSIAPLVLTTDQRANGGHCPYLPGENAIVRPDFDTLNERCVLASGKDDRLQGKFVHIAGVAIADVAMVNPQALVFNAQTHLPVANVLVSVVLSSTDEIATNRVTGALLQAVTRENGLYSLPRLQPGIDYYLRVEPPASHKFPSVVPMRTFTEFNVRSSSYGVTGSPDGASGIFRLEVDEVPFPVDIPVDSNVSERGLVVEKTATLPSIEPGQVVGYSVTVKNVDKETYLSIIVEDRPPFGFRYVPGSTRQGDEPIGDPVVSTDGRLRFAIGDMAEDETVRFTYYLRASAGAVDSDGVNTAYALGVTVDNAQFSSNISRAKVSIRSAGVLSDRATLFGKIFVDQNCDGVQSQGEWPIGGVKLYLQDGTYTISDADGLYSLYGLRPGSHVIKVDNHSLPMGLRLKLLDTNQGVDPNSRFVDLAQGDFYRTDFAAHCPDEDVDIVFAEIQARNKALNSNWLLSSAEKFQANEQLVQRNPQADANIIDGDLSNGVFHGPKNSEEKFNSALSMKVLQARATKQRTVEASMPDPKKRVSSITQAQGKAGTWLWPLQELSTDGRFVVVIREGIEPILSVNGKPVAATQIGERLINRRERAQIVAWYGVELDAGDNKVEVTGTDPFGNHRVLAEGVFKRPTSATQIRLTAAESIIQADGGRSSLPIRVELLDDNELPALGVYFITLESSAGGFLEEDIQDSEPGRQIRVSNGARTVNFISSTQTGQVILRASTGAFFDDIVIQQISESRPLLANGFIEAGAAISSVSSSGSAPTGNSDTVSGENGIDARASVFIKGRVKDKYNLTLSYDSDKKSNELLLRDINPSQHYPIHGDASVRGYEAQSRSKLYVKVEENADVAMWGDFLTDTDSEQGNLAISRRALTGFNASTIKRGNRIRVFAAMQDDPRVAEEIPGNGSAMLYQLESFPIVANSEVVEIISRSRDNPGLITGRTRLNRFSDYTIDPVEGFVSFSSVIPTLDDQQDPVYVRISYDVEKGGDTYTVAGIRFDRTFNEHLRFGVSFTRDDNNEDGSQLMGGYASYKMATGTQLFSSIASSDSILQGKGNAFRFSAEHLWRRGARTSFSHVQADGSFSNISATAIAGRRESRISHKQKIIGDSDLTVSIVKSDSSVTKENRTTLSALVETRLRQWLVRAGLRQINYDDASSADSFLTTVLGVDRKIFIGGKNGSVRAEYEQDIGLASRRRVALGAKMQLHEKVRVYSNYELANSLLGLTGLSFDQNTETLTMGIESNVLPSTRLYSEYRLRGAIDGRDYAAATGVRGDYEIRENLRLTPSFEIIQSVSDDADSIAASISVVDSRDLNSRRLGRLEARKSDTTDYIGVRASYAARVNEDWTAVVTENLSNQTNVGTEDSLRHSFVAGLSRRPKRNNRHHMLLMYNWKEESGLGNGFDRSVQLLSTHQNLQLSNRTLLSGRIGGKQQTSRLGSVNLTDFALLADARLNFDINRRFNIDIRGGVLATDGSSEMRFSAGAGIHFVINKNARIGVSYNFGGFRDADLDHEEYNTHGFRVGVQFKFDEELFEWLQ